MTTQLEVWNEVARLLGQPPINTLAPDPSTELSRQLTAGWRSVVERCLEQTSFRFAMKRGALARIGSNAFGFAYRYQRPADCLRMVELSMSGRDFDPMPAESYVEESGVYATDADALYGHWVTSDAIDQPGRWSSTFTEYVSLKLALSIAPNVNASAIDMLIKLLPPAEKKAMAVDAVQQTRRQRRSGSWSTANMRHSRGGDSRGRGGSISGRPEQQD